MAISLTNITPMSDLNQYSSDVEIFTNTKAVEIPAKLDAVATDVKTYVNSELTTPVQGYVQDELVVKLQNAISDVEQGFNDGYNHLVANLAQYTSENGGYLVEGANKGIFTGDNVAAELQTEQDSEGRLTRWYSNGTLHTLTWGEDGLPATATETIDLNGTVYTKSYEIIVDSNFNWTFVEVV